MKKVLAVAFCLMVCMLLSPILAIKGPISSAAVSAAVNREPIDIKQETEDEYFSVYNKETEKVQKISKKDYLFGVVAAEMPISYDDEALKAQAVAAHTFALFRKAENADKDYDITTDYTIDQSYISHEKAKERWGEKYEENAKKLKGIIDEVGDFAITYNSSPILAAYCASSAGKTQSAKDVWGGEYPYLASVTSEWDRLDKGNLSTLKISATELKKKLSSLAEIKGSHKEWITKIEKNDAGYVTALNLCTSRVSGSKVREALSLKSNAFSIALEGKEFTFSVSGYGHGVGMSQVGAGAMAKQGATYEEILMHYYSGCTLEKI